jgi:hypothetical protein
MSAIGNEAVHVDQRTGERTVDLPPGSGPGGSRRLLTPFADPSGEVFLIETKKGLVECSQALYRDKECRAPTFGQGRRPRTWVVKRQDKWWRCSRPARDAGCGPLEGLWLNSSPAM